MTLAVDVSIVNLFQNSILLKRRTSELLSRVLLLSKAHAIDSNQTSNVRPFSSSKRPLLATETGNFSCCSTG